MKKEKKRGREKDNALGIHLVNRLSGILPRTFWDAIRCARPTSPGDDRGGGGGKKKKGKEEKKKRKKKRVRNLTY